MGPQQWGHVRDEAGVAVTIDVDGFGEILCADLRCGRQGGCVDRRMDPKVKPAPAVIDRPAELLHGGVKW
jgi:hypothetical protein